ncbi:MAG: VWA domain-containing protein, partial [Candidatus Tectomicrobia bacterium]|nr:VWA domain-containing protein [Candidatus Tectomicrobia bacterium]
MPPAAARHYVSAMLFLSGFSFSVAGFASPMLQRTAWEPFWENVALVVMMDFSRSMEAPRNPDELNAPSRFVETRQNILGFLSNLPPGVKVSFVPFSELAIPITSGFSDDHGELVAKVRRLQREFFFKQGTDLALALQEGFNLADAFVQMHADNGNGAGRPPVTSIILMSDGDEPIDDDLRKAVNERPANQIPVFTIGIGSPV